ncbi:MAG: hypothetical protein CMP81_22950 [Fulvimarina sp.]|nr:hypothetical protein [Fulvimarina sp.]
MTEPDENDDRAKVRAAERSERDEIGFDRPPAPSSDGRMIFSENRFPLFGIMLWCRMIFSENRSPLFGIML